MVNMTFPFNKTLVDVTNIGGNIIKRVIWIHLLNSFLWYEKLSDAFDRCER